MKKITFVLLIAFLSSCAAKNSSDSKKEELSKFKTELIELQQKIADLENELADDPANEANGSFEILVGVKEITYEAFNHYFEISGSIEAAKSAFISPELNGQIKKIYVAEGQRVKKGDLLAKINTSILESSISGIETGLELATIIFEKQQQLWNKKIGSEIDFLTAKNAKEALEDQLVTLEAQLDQAFIKAPYEGIIDNIMQKEGDLASPGIQIMQLVNLDKIYINADVSESYLPVIHKGDTVDLSFPVFPDLTLTEQIHHISNIIHPQNRTVNLQLRIRNKNEILKPNGMAIIRINDFSSKEALVVPSIIIKQDMSGFFLYIVKQENKNWIAEKRYVKPGVSYQDQSMITEGIAVGESVIVEGYNQISDGSVIKTK
ncbi:MAG: efflux RND transporter periplasmic adaptor subunit [Bacteroidetes bacterium]|nr:efflux RND transporter periplasmic adaptor subunit [Bacteroidota bacterium]